MVITIRNMGFHKQRSVNESRWIRVRRAWQHIPGVSQAVTFPFWIIFWIAFYGMPSDVHGLQRPPNIVLLVADDLGYGELFGQQAAEQGFERVPMPNLKRLAAAGVSCTQAYVTAPNCSPSRAGFFTGKIPTRFGYEFNPIGARNEDPGTGLPKSEVMLAEFLHDAGYTTSLIGKWHLGGSADYHPLRRGFDEFFGFLHEGHYYVPAPWDGAMTMLRRKAVPGVGEDGVSERYQARANLLYSSHMGHDEPAYDANNPILRGGQPVVEREYLTDALTREAVSFIERHRDNPFFLCLTYNAVHSPLQAKLETLGKFGYIEDVHRRIFAAMLSDLDNSVGVVMDRIEELNLSQDTLIVLLSDNGGPTKELTSSNLPLRGGKGSMYEGGLRVPMLFQWKGQLPAGRVCDTLLSSLDLFPTIAAAATLQVPLPPGLDGYNVLPVLKGETDVSPHARLFWRQGKRAALREGDWKIVTENPRAQNPRTQDPRAQDPSAEARAWQLFNIAEDISEHQDRSEEFPNRLNAMKSTWNSLNSEMSEPLF